MFQDIYRYNNFLTCYPPGELTYDSRGFDGVHHLLQRLNVLVLVGKLLLLVVQVASSLNECRMRFKHHSGP